MLFLNTQSRGNAPALYVGMIGRKSDRYKKLRTVKGKNRQQIFNCITPVFWQDLSNRILYSEYCSVSRC